MILRIIKNELHGIKRYLLFEVGYIFFDLMTLVIINGVLGDIFPENTEIRNLLLFLFALLLNLTFYLQAKKISIGIVETIIGKIRWGIIEKVHRTDLESFEKLGKSSIYNTITMDTQTLSDVAHTFGWVNDALLICASLLAYQFIICKPAFFFTAGIFGLGALIYTTEILLAKKWFHQAREREKKLFDAIGGVIYGFKELKINDRKNDHFFNQALVKRSAENRLARTRAENALAFGNVTASFFEWAAFIPILFIIPAFGRFSIHELAVSVVSLLFFPFNLIKDTIPYLLRGWIAVERIEALIKTLETLKSNEPEGAVLEEEPGRFKELHYRNLCFSYLDRKGNPAFSIDHIDLSIIPGEILFITGGNGSGKSTLIKTLVGLYTPVSGSIEKDGEAISTSALRNLFSVVFFDCHLFDRLYGLGTVEVRQVEMLLKTLGLDEIVSFRENRFTPLTLSGGQRKRLALLEALLEEKPVYVFDEWAADQSPRFRDYFYHHLLPTLKKQGKTVIAVTHDDQFFHMADRVLKMDYGRFARE